MLLGNVKLIYENVIMTYKRELNYQNVDQASRLFFLHSGRKHKNKPLDCKKY